MRNYHSNEMGTVAVLGHSGSGKTSVIESMAYRSGQIGRVGTIKEGNTLSDYDQEEIKRQSSLSLSVIPVEWNNCKVNLLDTPGAFDFNGEIEAALAVAESALIVVPATKGLTTGTKQAMYKAHDKARIIYINGIDYPNADYSEKLKELQETYGRVIAPIQVPIMENNKMIGYVNVAKMEGRIFEGTQTKACPIPEGMDDLIEPVKAMIDEAVANTSDELLEKYLNEEPFTKEEISLALRQGVVNKSLIPVLCGTNQIGISIILNSMVAFFSASGDMSNSYIIHNNLTDEDEIVGFDEKLPPACQVFKTYSDPFIGRISLVKVLTGTLRPNTTMINQRSKGEEKIGKLYIMQGKNTIEVDELNAGDIGAITKCEGIHLSYTLASPKKPVMVKPVKYPTATYVRGVVPATKNDSDKLFPVIEKMQYEDPTIFFEKNPITNQILVGSLSSSHLQYVLDKIKEVNKINFELERPRVVYKETITTRGEAEGRYIKQSGGSGYYGVVNMAFEPAEESSFQSTVFGGHIDKGYFPAVEKGFYEALEHGGLIGAPVIKVKATLLDGKQHTVDSNEMAFKNAAVLAFHEAYKACNPILLEPFDRLVVNVTSEYLGAVLSDLSKRRGKILSTDEGDEGTLDVVAVVPEAEIQEYANELKSITKGTGFFNLAFEDYEPVPGTLVDKVIQENKK
jgi:elongation factor G